MVLEGDGDSNKSNDNGTEAKSSNYLAQYEAAQAQA